MPIRFEITNTQVTPPGGWNYKQPESGAVFKSYDYKSWKDAVLSHRKANGYPIPINFEQELINDACHQNPDWKGNSCKNILNRNRRKVPLSFERAVAFLKVLQSFVVDSKAQFVDQEEAERRASMCVGCPNNQETSFGCGACVAVVDGFISALLGKKSTTSDQKLGFCAICSCKNSISVHYPLEAQKHGLTEEMKQMFHEMEDQCWKKDI